MPKNWRTAGAVVAATALLPLLTPGPATAAEPVRLTFDKAAVSAGTWAGTVTFEGEPQPAALTTVLTGFAVVGPNLLVSFDWIIDAGERSFTASMDGVLNGTTGSVVMNGTVVEGWGEGARVHEQGTLVDPATQRYSGTIRVQGSG
ncbi:MAG TPA: hypothetical protein VK894_07570 [Jiangellales bacterium]|nr:hypothetical protein [Jiangellales bacterium]